VATMPSLPNIGRTRRGRSDAAGPRPEPTALDVQVNESHGLTWVNLEAPTEQVADWLERNYDFHPLDLEDVRSRRRQRAKIDTYDDYVFVVLHFPRFDKRTGRLQPAEVDIFVAENLVITIPKEPMKALRGLWSRCLVGEEADVHMSRGSGYLFYEIVDTMYDYCFPILDKIGFKLDRIEDEMFEGASEEIVRDISNVKQEIISYRKIIKPERTTLRLLERYTERFLPQDLEVYFDDIVDASERVWDLLDNYKEVVEGLESTNESAIQHKQNDVLRILTIFSVTMLPLTLIAGIFGMNVDFPGESGRAAFWAILGALVLALIGMFAFFRWRKWL
jgi:magnesium transporter